MDVKTLLSRLQCGHRDQTSERTIVSFKAQPLKISQGEKSRIDFGLEVRQMIEH